MAPKKWWNKDEAGRSAKLAAISVIHVHDHISTLTVSRINFHYSPDPPLREPTIKRTQVVWRPGGPKRLECACFSAVKVPFFRQNRLRERVTPRAPVLLTVGPDCRLPTYPLDLEK